ncbi:hypothetical protein D3C77_725440 [compost metagenome]
MKAEIHRQALGVAGQGPIRQRHVVGSGHFDGLYVLSDKAIAGDDSLALRALGKLYQCLGPRRGLGR